MDSFNMPPLDNDKVDLLIKCKSEVPENERVDFKESSDESKTGINDSKKQKYIPGGPIIFSKERHPKFRDLEATEEVICKTEIMGNEDLLTICHMFNSDEEDDKNRLISDLCRINDNNGKSLNLAISNNDDKRLNLANSNNDDKCLNLANSNNDDKSLNLANSNNDDKCLNLAYSNNDEESINLADSNNDEDSVNLADSNNDDEENSESAELSDLEITFEPKSSIEYKTPTRVTKIKKHAIKSRARPFSCDVRSKTFMNEHQKNHSLDSGSIKCDLCSKPYKSERALRQHKKTHRALDFVCQHPGCFKAFAEKSILDVHSRKHSVIHPYICEICRNSYMVKSHLNSHKLSHSEKFVCDFCGKEYTAKKNYIRHCQQHSRDNSFGLQLCQKVFSSNETLYKHVAGHKDGKTYQCEICYKTLKSLSSLNFHKRLHYGTKDFKCEHCSKSFATRKYLMIHLKNHDRVFPCKLCKVIFNNQNELKEHFKKSHHPKKVALECCQCGKIFSAKAKFNKHIKTHKRIEQNSDNDFSMAGSENLNDSNDYSMKADDSDKMSTDDENLNDSNSVNTNDYWRMNDSEVGEMNDSYSVDMMNDEDNDNEVSDIDNEVSDIDKDNGYEVSDNDNEGSDNDNEVTDNDDVRLFTSNVNNDGKEYGGNAKSDHDDDDGPLTFTVNGSINNSSESDDDSSDNEESSSGRDQKGFRTDSKINVNLYSSFNISSHFKLSAYKKH